MRPGTITGESSGPENATLRLVQFCPTAGGGDRKSEAHLQSCKDSSDALVSCLLLTSPPLSIPPSLHPISLWGRLNEGSPPSTLPHNGRRPGRIKDDVSGVMCVSPASDANRLVTLPDGVHVRACMCVSAGWADDVGVVNVCV